MTVTKAIPQKYGLMHGNAEKQRPPLLSYSHLQSSSESQKADAEVLDCCLGAAGKARLSAW